MLNNNKDADDYVFQINPLNSQGINPISQEAIQYQSL